MTEAYATGGDIADEINPMGTDGFEFVEYTAPDPQALGALFESMDIGCSGCHSGPRLTDNSTRLVGTGGAFQVPSLLGLAARAPYMHDGCAKTLRDRFTNLCAGGNSHAVVIVGSAMFNRNDSMLRVGIAGASGGGSAPTGTATLIRP